MEPKVWTYTESVAILPEIQTLVYEIKKRFIASTICASKANALPIGAERDEFSRKFEINDEKGVTIMKKLLNMGIEMHNAVHGIVRFPFYHPLNGSNCYFLYRDGDDTINTWVTAEQANNDLNYAMTKFKVGIINPIDSLWMDW